MGHPVGTCAIGRADDPHAVVDHACRVYGVNNLRVIDASVMPSVAVAVAFAASMSRSTSASVTAIGRAPWRKKRKGPWRCLGDVAKGRARSVVRQARATETMH